MISEEDAFNNIPLAEPLPCPCGSLLLCGPKQAKQQCGKPGDGAITSSGLRGCKCCTGITEANVKKGDGDATL